MYSLFSFLFRNSQSVCLNLIFFKSFYVRLLVKCDGSDGRAAASYPEDPGLNLAVSGSYEIVFNIVTMAQMAALVSLLVPMRS